ncbi:MAG: hypothetical protein IJ317_03350 [Clostridia bacterium]|nr:hypothetical protein [Clostridia bacterium]
MYCKKCGKFIGTDEDLCYECKSVELMEEKPVEPTPQPQQAYAQPQPTYAPQPTPVQPVQPQTERAGNVMTGFGKALAGTIVGFFGFIFACIALGAGVAGGFTGAFFVLWSIAIAGGVISLIFGIQSIKVFKREKRADRKPPIPALVLGIVSTVLAGLALLYGLLALICALAYVPDPYYYYYDEYYY